MGLLHRRKNKKYDYQPRYYNNEDGGRPFEIKHQFDDHRYTVHKHNLKGKFNNAMRDYKEGTDAKARVRIYVIAAVLILLFLWLIDFDLSIFTSA